MRNDRTTKEIIQDEFPDPKGISGQVKNTHQVTPAMTGSGPALMQISMKFQNAGGKAKCHRLRRRNIRKQKRHKMPSDSQ